MGEVKMVEYTFIKDDGTQESFQAREDIFSPEYDRHIKDNKTCAYIKKKDDDTIYRFIKYKGGYVYDVMRNYDRGYVNMDWSFKKVKSDIFVMYLKYIGVIDTFKNMRGKKFILSQIENIIN